jgi:hypothetical protein
MCFVNSWTVSFSGVPNNPDVTALAAKLPQMAKPSFAAPGGCRSAVEVEIIFLRGCLEKKGERPLFVK